MTTSTYMTPSKVAVMGFRALVDRLGAGGAIEFIHQYEAGAGDYTKERKHILQGFRLEQVASPPSKAPARRLLRH